MRKRTKLTVSYHKDENRWTLQGGDQSETFETKREPYDAEPSWDDRTATRS
jgi:hypothetical protein